MLQETKLLQSIDRLRGEADVVKREQRVAQALALMACPKAWSLSNGGSLEVHTPATTKWVPCSVTTVCLWLAALAEVVLLATLSEWLILSGL